MTERKDPLAHMIPTDGLRDVDILILDAFAVAGGSASRDQAFDLVERKLWGHMAGTDKRQTFDDAIERLVQQGALVPWGTERVPTLALPPRPYELPPRRPGGKPYIPGTEYWASERDTHLSEAHRQLAVHLQEVDALRAKFMQEFAPERTRLLQVIKRQIARRQMDESARNDMVVALSKLLLSSADIAAALELSEAEVDAALNPKPAPARRSRSRQVDAKSETTDANSEIDDANSENGANQNVLRLVRLAQRKGGSVDRSTAIKNLHLSATEADSLLDSYGQIYPGCIEWIDTGGPGRSAYRNIIHAPTEKASA